jgi:8-oxo-dGTP pyrophosphatase MutT (NUDIX family)
VAPQFPVAVHIFFFHRGNVLLLRRFNTGYEDGNYSVPAGHLEGDETVVQAAIREAREETGVETRPGDVTVIGTMHRRSGDERMDFAATLAPLRPVPVPALDGVRRRSSNYICNRSILPFTVTMNPVPR